MNEMIIDALICAFDVVAGAAVGVISGKVARGSVNKKIKRENFESDEEFSKAFKKEAFKASLAATAVTVATSTGIAVGSAYLITEVTPGLSGESGDAEGDGTEADGSEA